MKLDAHSKTIEQILKEGRYIIPDYQRPYSWSKVQIEELLDDIEIGRINDSTHFLGTMMLNIGKDKKEGIIEIIDGQQRLSTIVMILYAILEMYNLPRFCSIENIEGRKIALSQKLNELNDDSVIVGNKLTLGESNRQFFKSYVIEALNSDAQKESIIEEYKRNGKLNTNRRISETYKIIVGYFKNSINKLIDEEAYEFLKDYQSYVLLNLEIVAIKVEEDADAFLIFETLNDRGLALSAVDLIKNILFKNCAHSREFDEIKKKWTGMVDNLEDINEVKKYIRHYWLSKYGYVSSQDLFKQYRDYLKSDVKKSNQMIEELYKYSNFYDSLKNPRNGYLCDEKLIEVLQEMNKFKFDLANPILISCFIKYNSEEKLYLIAKLCLNFLIRYISIMKGKPTTIEKKISELAIKSSEQEIENVFKQYSDDNILKDILKTISINYKSYLAYYLLVEYEKTLHNNEPWDTTGRTDITVEHILPQTVNSEDKYGENWIKSFKTYDDCKIYENRLGNLSLLGKTPQSKAKNKDFNSKKEVYKEFTDMFSTRELLEYDDWNRDSIEKRQKTMSHNLLNILCLDICN